MLKNFNGMRWIANISLVVLFGMVACTEEVTIKEGQKISAKPALLNTFPFPPKENQDFTIQSFYTKPVILQNIHLDTLASYKSLNGTKIDSGYLEKGIYFFKGEDDKVATLVVN